MNRKIGERNVVVGREARRSTVSLDHGWRWEEMGDANDMTGEASYAPSRPACPRLPNHFHFQGNVTFPGCPPKPEVPAWSPMPCTTTSRRLMPGFQEYSTQA